MIRIVPFGQWALASRALKVLPDRIKRAIDQAAIQEAHFYRAKVLRGFATSGASNGRPWKPLKQSTLENRRQAGISGTKPLMARGDLRNSISVVKGGIGEAFVGVKRGAMGRNGQRLTDVAAVHEFGKTITQRVTARQVAFFNARNFAAGRGRTSLKPGDTIVIRVPARPFLGPVISKYGGRKGQERIMARTAANLGGLLGRVPIPHTA